MSFTKIMEDFILNPSTKTLIPLQAAIMAAPNYDPLALVEPSITLHLENNTPQAVIETLWTQMPGLFLSPSTHGCLAHAYREAGDITQANREQKLAELALASITTSGDGTQTNPYPVLRVSDEYDVIRFLNQSVTAQRAILLDDIGHDVFTCADSTELYFKLLWQQPKK